MFEENDFTRRPALRCSNQPEQVDLRDVVQFLHPKAQTSPHCPHPGLVCDPNRLAFNPSSRIESKARSRVTKREVHHRAAILHPHHAPTRSLHRAQNQPPITHPRRYPLRVAEDGDGRTRGYSVERGMAVTAGQRRMEMMAMNPT